MPEKIWYITARENVRGRGRPHDRGVGAVGYPFSDADWKLAHEAARFKPKARVLCRLFAAALAKENKADLVTGIQNLSR